MREIRILFLVLSVTLLASFVGGCSTRLADPKGPNSSFVMGRVVIDNQDPDGDLPMGNVQKGIMLAIESRDELQFARVVPWIRHSPTIH